MSGGKFRIFNPRLNDYEFSLNYNSCTGVETGFNDYYDVDGITCVRSFRVDNLIQEIQSGINDKEVKSLMQNLYSLAHNINYSLSGDYRRDSFISTYYDVRDDIDKIENMNTDLEQFIFNREELCDIYTSKTVNIEVEREKVNVYQIQKVDSVECLNNIIDIQDCVSGREENLLVSIKNILYNLKKNDLDSTNNEIEELRSLKPF
jgi:hypothetical protein